MDDVVVVVAAAIGHAFDGDATGAGGAFVADDACNVDGAIEQVVARSAAVDVDPTLLLAAADAVAADWCYFVASLPLP